MVKLLRCRHGSQLRSIGGELLVGEFPAVANHNIFQLETQSPGKLLGAQMIGAGDTGEVCVVFVVI